MIDPTAEPGKKKEDKITTLKFGESEIKIVRKPKQNKQNKPANDGSRKGGNRKSSFMRRRRSVDEGIAGGDEEGDEAGAEDAGEEASHPHDGVRWTPLKRKLFDIFMPRAVRLKERVVDGGLATIKAEGFVIAEMRAAGFSVQEGKPT